MTNRSVTAVTGQRVAGRYLLQELLGKGGHGSVWRAIDAKSEDRRQVAIKLLRAKRRGDPTIAGRFEREAASLRRLVHPNTVRLLDFGTTDQGELYLTLELLTGQSLDEGLAAPLTPEAIRLVALDVLQSLAEAHTLEILHRDLKPANVFLRDGAGAKVLDWGLAKSIGAQANDGPQLTEQGVVVGSVHYMAPEVLRGESATAASDIYSLGCTLFAALCGRSPREQAGGVAGAVAKAHAGGPPPVVTRAGRGLTGSLVDGVRSMMRHDPRERPSTMAALMTMASITPPLAAPAEAPGAATQTVLLDDGDSAATQLL